MIIRKTVSYDISIDTLRDPEGTMTIRTPFTDDIAASFSHQGVLSNFLSHGDIEYSGRKQHEISIAFQNYENRKFTEFDYNKRKVSVEINIDKAAMSSVNGVLIVIVPSGSRNVSIEMSYETVFLL
jgi:hypothetical protein